jgi:hypothetical protein
MKLSNLCRHLRTKKMYIPALAEEAFSHDSPESPGASHCWCNRTMSETGPDDRPIGAQECKGGRSCFEQ